MHLQTMTILIVCVGMLESENNLRGCSYSDIVHFISEGVLRQDLTVVAWAGIHYVDQDDFEIMECLFSTGIKGRHCYTHPFDPLRLFLRHGLFSWVLSVNLRCSSSDSKHSTVWDIPQAPNFHILEISVHLILPSICWKYTTIIDSEDTMLLMY